MSKKEKLSEKGIVVNPLKNESFIVEEGDGSFIGYSERYGHHILELRLDIKCKPTLIGNCVIVPLDVLEIEKKIQKIVGSLIPREQTIEFVDMNEREADIKRIDAELEAESNKVLKDSGRNLFKIDIELKNGQLYFSGIRRVLEFV